MKPIASRKVLMCLEHVEKVPSFCSSRTIFVFFLILYFAKLHLCAFKPVCFSSACFLDSGVPEIGISMYI